ncbi:mechanosensitive ion channel family protein [Litorihabitans aurantiacus]|uniref:Mechanosensitive ion channel protein MscS n=1 Tax=Litorihabitans aurantiacus TaxID=1930061 RepID=A0AA37XFQ3_9MICO|nr:mechanosensitive ion channel family protein [Litorihabitans aurantiacus]GMA31910.1 mechanosensitive ion channel protein MscS [Litorihabitans aurantiacus]
MTFENAQEAAIRSAIIIAIGIVLVIIARWVLGRVVGRLSRTPRAKVNKTGRFTVSLGSVPIDHARVRRLRTLHQLLASTITVVVSIIVFSMVLSAFGVDIAPLIASAGVIGVALAFGAQSVVSDLLAGLFMLVENQCNVGDRVELGALGSTLAAGTVEEVGLRVTTIRDDDGRLWYVRNGQILRVANESQGWSLAVVDIAFDPAVDLTQTRDLVEGLVTEAVSDPGLRELVLTDREPTVRVSDIGAASAVLQVRVESQPGENQRVASVLRRRLHDEFATRGITLA